MTTVNAKRGPRIVEKSKRLMKQTNFSENNGIQKIDQYAFQKVFLHSDKVFRMVFDRVKPAYRWTNVEQAETIRLLTIIVLRSVSIPCSRNPNEC